MKREKVILTNFHISEPWKTQLEFTATIEEKIKIGPKILSKYIFGPKKQMEVFVVQKWPNLGFYSLIGLKKAILL